ncbi:hypothetical protein K488DRAFT_39841 [Vararia minispora EC-137]|uniref:Uncharacterized protein n=1 Tax=Vararia minispora EC-137 TaxID=1314806 RepID=A0ACB8QYU2_9AGAM|nr:hypothetical protein K488DRAFT_39841 [Vararia minispora EC-137]
MRAFRKQRPTPSPRPGEPYHASSPRSPFGASVLRKKALARLPNEPRKRTLFGIGEVMSVITNPAETLRSLTEARRLLEEARQEINENREKAQLRPSHTFSRLPGFFPRPAEMQAIERTLEEEPCFTVLFGASSVGKTAILRQLLSSEKYHVLHFDLRIAGFADLESLYISLSQQMEQYFGVVAQTTGFEEFEKEAWGFKACLLSRHDRRNVEQRLERGSEAAAIRTSDIARLMELFQSSLLKYREFVPRAANRENGEQPELTREPISVQSGRKKQHRWWRFGRNSPTSQLSNEATVQNQSEPKLREKLSKRMPVFFLDEAHKLPGLIQSVEAMKVLLDSMLVFTKQDRLCHVIHSTSDPFYQTWLRQLNVMQHCKIITIGDCSKLETRSFYERRLLPRVPETQRGSLDFERLYEAFGGRLVHWQDFITDYGTVYSSFSDLQHSSHFIQAHSLLNLHIIHSSHLADPNSGTMPRSRRNSAAPTARHSTVNFHESSQLGGGGNSSSGFPIYNPLSGPPRNPHATSTSMPEPSYTSDFTALQLLRIMSRLTQPGTRSLSYFLLCREFGARAVDGMIRGRILDLRWMEPVTSEDEPEASAPPARERGPDASRVSIIGMQRNASHSGTAIASDFVDVEDELPEIQAAEVADDDAFGPKVLPATPILRYAMAAVVAEYEDTGSASEYASLSDIDEY